MEDNKIVFISYAREDKEIARRLYIDLNKAGLKPWMDTEDIYPGENWKVAIRRAIGECSFFLLLLSSSSITKRGYVQKEVKIALDLLDEFPVEEVFIIPVRLDDSIPKDDKLKDLQWVDLYKDYDSSFSRILLVIAPQLRNSDKPKLLDRHKINQNVIRILLVDSEALTRAGIHTLLQKLPNVQVVAEAKDGREAMKLVEKHQPDIVFTEISLKEMNGLELIVWIKNTYPGIKAIILSLHTYEEYVFQALRAGADGYLLKDSAISELEIAINSVYQGKRYLSSKVTFVYPFNQLTQQQRVILQLIGEGNNNHDIGEKLNINIETVDQIQNEIMKALDIHDIPGLVRFAVRTGMISLLE